MTVPSVQREVAVFIANPGKDVIRTALEVRKPHTDKANWSIGSLLRRFQMSRVRSLLMFGLIASTSTGAWGQLVEGAIAAPSIDRWVYPFAGNGREGSVPVFAALRQPGFEDRDSNMLVGFTTSTMVPAGLGEERYIINEVRITVYVQGDDRFEYDGTFDSVVTSYAVTDPDYVADADAGKPIELFAAGYRNGFNDVTFLENSPYTQGPVPAEGVANVYPAILNSSGQPATDVGRHVRQKYEAVPLAVGVNDELAPGALVPAGTAFTFNVDLSTPAARAYVARGINAGQVRFMISSLHATSGGPGGGTGGLTYPSIYTKESAVAQSAGLIANAYVAVTVFPGADFNQDGGVDGGDVEAFFIAWTVGELFADFNLDGGVDGADVEAFFLAWVGG
jgi:hypothetical protein